MASLFDDGNLPSSNTSAAGNKLVQWWGHRTMTKCVKPLRTFGNK